MGGKSYSYPQFRWYQFIQKRRWDKAMSRFSAGERIKMRTSRLNGELPTFTDDFTVSAWINRTQPNNPVNKVL